jgi:hypothetical protein
LSILTGRDQRPAAPKAASPSDEATVTRAIATTPAPPMRPKKRLPRESSMARLYMPRPCSCLRRMAQRRVAAVWGHVALRNECGSDPAVYGRLLSRQGSRLVRRSSGASFGRISIARPEAQHAPPSPWQCERLVRRRADECNSSKSTLSGRITGVLAPVRDQQCRALPE